MAVCVGCGLTVDDGVLVAHIKPGGGLICSDVDGLSVDFPAGLDPISPDACNGISRRGNGLYAPCPDAIVGTIIQLSPQSGVLPLAATYTGSPTTFSFLNSNSATSIHICNTTCCTVEGFVEMTVGGLEIDAAINFFGTMEIHVNINSGGFGAVSPLSGLAAHNVGNAVQRFSFNNQHAELYLSLAAGACADYQWGQVLTVNAGTGTLFSNVGGPSFQTRWMLVQTGCC